MAECELRQRKKEDDSEDNSPSRQTGNDELKSCGQDRVQRETKSEPVRFVHNLVERQFLIFPIP